IPVIQPYVERASHLLHHGQELTFSDLTLKLFSDTIGQVAFGVDFGLTKGDASSATTESTGSNAATDFIRKHFYATTSLKMDLSGSLSIVLGQFVPFLQEPARQLLMRIPGSADRRMEETNMAMSGLLDDIVAERVAQVERRKGEKNFLSVLLNARESTEAMEKLAGSPGHVRAPARRVGHHVVHAVQLGVPGGDAPGSGEEAAPGDRRFWTYRRRTHR
ncbi:unnamed protein product, partial [Urochloa humidicola]